MTSQQMFRRHNVCNAIDVMANVVEVFDNMTHVMMCSLLQGEFVVVMTYFMTSFWCPDIFVHHLGNKIFWRRIFDVIDIMIYFWLHNKTYLWRHAQLLYRPDIFVIISGTKYYENVCLMSLTLSYMMTNLLMSSRVFDVIDVFLTSWLTFWIMLHLLTSWQTFWCHVIFWRHDTLLTSWRTTLWRTFCRDDVFLSIFREQNIM